MVSGLLFYVFGTAALILAVMCVTTSRIFRSAVYLMGVLLCTAALYVLLEAHFLAAIQVLVYVGGIVVLIVFAIMLTQSSELVEDKPAPLRQTFGLIASGSFIMLAVAALGRTILHLSRPTSLSQHDVAAVGTVLLDYRQSGYAVPFELISLLLLAAIVGGIVIARKSNQAELPE